LPPFAHAVTDGSGKFVLAPRAFYIAKGGMNSSDPLTLVAVSEQITNGVSVHRAALMPLSFEAQSRALPAFTVNTTPLRPVRIDIPVLSGGVSDRVQIEVLPIDSTEIQDRGDWRPRRIIEMPMRTLDADHRRVVVALPSGAHYRVHLPVADGRSTLGLAPFAVSPGRDTLTLDNYSVANNSQRVASSASRTSTSELQATTVEGKPVRLADYRGKVVVLDFWGFWCLPCLAKMPALNNLAARFRDSNVVVLVIHDASIASATEYQREYAKLLAPTLGTKTPAFVQLIDAPQMSGDGTPGKPMTPVREQGTGKTITAFGVRAFPMTMVIDPKGNLVGLAPNVEVRARVDASGNIVPVPEDIPVRDEQLEALIRRARQTTP